MDVEVSGFLLDRILLMMVVFGVLVFCGLLIREVDDVVMVCIGVVSVRYR